MTKIRQQYSEQFKFKVALEAIKGLATINEIASRFQVHPNQVRNWKKQLTEDGPTVFERKSGKHHQTLSAQEAELYEQIGRLKMELEWLKKKLPESIEAKRKMIETNNPKISLRRQCSLVGLSRATAIDALKNYIEQPNVLRQTQSGYQDHDALYRSIDLKLCPMLMFYDQLITTFVIFST